MEKWQWVNKKTIFKAFSRLAIFSFFIARYKLKSYMFLIITFIDEILNRKKLFNKNLLLSYLSLKSKPGAARSQSRFMLMLDNPDLEFDLFIAFYINSVLNKKLFSYL